MRFSLITILLIFHLDHTAAVAQEGEAPFGLSWGLSVEQVKSMGVELKQQEQGTFGSSYLGSKLPKAISDQEVTFLSFGNDNKLWRIMAGSKPFENDPYGSTAKDRYGELVGALTEKYGKGDSVHQLGESIYAEPRYFVAGIRGGESHWFTNFENPSLFIQLGLMASSNDTVRWRIIYENKPLKNAFEQDQKAREKGSL